MDQKKWYSNFGPLEQSLRIKFLQCFFNNSDKENITFTNTGTMAICLALKALQLKANSKVLVPSITFPATAIAVINAGLEPVFVDTDPELELTSHLARQCLNKYDISAVIPVFFHSKNSISEWDTFTQETNIPVVIDACPALGKQTLPERCVITYSLHATKFYGCGEGGVVVANNTDLISSVRMLSNFGIGESGIDLVGDNGKFSEFHAAVAHAQLQRYEVIKHRKSALVEKYKNEISRSFFSKDTISDLEKDPSYMLLNLNKYNTDNFIDYLSNENIHARLFHYPDLPKQAIFSHYEHQARDPDCYSLAGNIISLPFYCNLSDKDIEQIVRTVNNYTETSNMELSHYE